MVTHTLTGLFAAALAQPAASAPAPATDTRAPAVVMGPWESLLHKAGELLTEYGLRVVGALIFLACAWIVSSYLVRLTVQALTKAHVDITLAKFLSNVARWGLLVLVIVACLGIFGVPATSFVTVLGTVGLAIGLAVQGSLSHMAAGVMLMLFRPFRVGDTVVIAGQLGTVDEIELFTTKLDTPDMRRVIIPNGQVYGAIIQNITLHQIRRVDAIVSVSHAADIDHTRKVLMDAARQAPGALPERSIDVVLAAVTPANVEWQVILWTKAADAGPAKQALLKAIKEHMDREDIAQPLPQVVLHAGPGIAAAGGVGVTAR